MRIRYLFFTVVWIGCGGDSPVVIEDDQPASVTISGGATIAIAANSQLTARVFTAGNRQIQATVEWLSSDPGVASVDQSGLVTGVQRGTATVSVTVVGTSISAQVTVTVTVAGLVAVADSILFGSLGDSASAGISAIDATGAVVAGAPIVYQSSAPLVAEVTPDGVVIARGNGSATVSGALDGQTKQVFAVVEQIATELSLNVDTVRIDAFAVDTAVPVAARDARGNVLTSPTLTWTSLDPSVASVDSLTGLVTSADNGTASILVQSGAIADTLIVIVQQQVVQFSITPTQTRLTSLGETIQLTAALRDRNGFAVGNAQVAWQSTDQSVVTIDQSGLGTAIANGLASVIASDGAGNADTAGITVEQVARTVVLTLDVDTLTSLGDTARVTVALSDGRGNNMQGTVSFVSSNATIATIDAGGIVVALANGAAQLSATTDSASATVTIVVRQKAVNLAITQAPDTLVSLDESGALTATAADARGNAITVDFVWSSDNASAVSVAGNTNQAVATAVANGSANISATRDGLASGVLVVVKQKVAAISVQPPAKTIVETFNAQATATVVDANGNQVAGQAVAWVTRNANVATIDGTGLVTADSAGTTFAVASNSGKSDSVAVTVNSITLANEVQPIFSANCALSGCHTGASPAQGQNLSSGNAHSNTVNVPANEAALMRILPFMPDFSYLVHKIQGTQASVGGSGGRMPLNRTPLTADQIALIRAWILKGALDN